MSNRGPQALSLAAQLGRLHSQWPQGHGSLSRGELRWYMTLQPTALSPNYAIDLRYRLGRRPEVHVVDPQLEAQDGLLPHHYADSGGICLSLGYEWDLSLHLALTTIPWTAEWLFHYEIWQFTGEWHGGGELLGEPQSLIDRRESRKQR